MRSRPSSRLVHRERAQATVELAIVLPVIVLLLLLVVQVGLVMRDRLLVVHAVRSAARAVIVEPDERAALGAMRRQGNAGEGWSLTLSGDRRPGGLVTVRVRARPTRVPIVGAVVSGLVVEERLTVLVEGGEVDRGG